MKRLIFQHILRPLIIRDFKRREAGINPDRWYWADKLAGSWGYFVTREDMGW